MRILLLSLLLPISISLSGQDVSTVKVDIAEKKITLNDLVITDNSNIETVVKALGKANRVHAIAGKERFYCYDEKGLSFEVMPDGSGKVIAMTVTYVWDKDKKVATGQFTGKIVIDGLLLHLSTSVEDIKEKTAITEMTCMGSICVSDLKAPVMGMMVYYTEEKKIAQVTFVPVQTR
jgi:hypothetical protein